MTTTKITCDDWRGEDVIDNRDLIEALEELESLADAGEEYDADLLAAIRDLADAGISDWQYGEALIRDEYFGDYAQQLAEDVGAIDMDAKWPHTCIDWEWAARELKYDYSAYDFLGYTYWVRS